MLSVNYWDTDSPVISYYFVKYIIEGLIGNLF